MVHKRKIPNLVHQTFAHFDDLTPDLLEKNRTMLLLNPNYKFELYDDVRMEEWIKTNCSKQEYIVFQRINPKYGAARADFFRYLLIYHIGGIYLDVKSSCIKPLDDVIRPSDQFLYSRWEVDPTTGNRKYGRHKELQKLEIDEFQQWFLISKPKNPVMLSVIQYVSEQILIPARFYRPKFGRLGVLQLTGPIAFSKVLAEFANLENSREIDSYSEGFRYKNLIENSEIVYTRKSGRHYTKLFEPIVLPNGNFTILLQTFLNFSLFQWFNKFDFLFFLVKRRFKASLKKFF